MILYLIKWIVALLLCIYAYKNFQGELFDEDGYYTWLWILVFFEVIIGISLLLYQIWQTVAWITNNFHHLTEWFVNFFVLL